MYLINGFDKRLRTGVLGVWVQISQPVEPGSGVVTQHHEFQSRLRDAERLQLYAQSAVSNHRALSASLVKAEWRSRGWEKEARKALRRWLKQRYREMGSP